MKKTNMKIVSLVLLVSMLLGVFSVSSVSAYTEEAYRYEEEIFELIELDYPREEHCYSEEFFYYGDNVTADEATPDYVMVMVHYAVVSDILVHSYIGEYAVVTGPYSPYIHGYHFYIPAENRLLTLEEAINSNLEGVAEALKSISHSVALVGDCDGDSELTIKDATCVQKCIAGLDAPKNVLGDYNRLVYDFNRDGERNIKDATAIQKCIAGLEY